MIYQLVQKTSSGLGWYAPHPADDGLATVNMGDVSSPLNQEQETILRRINPMTLSATFGIDLYLNAMNTMFSWLMTFIKLSFDLFYFFR